MKNLMTIFTYFCVFLFSTCSYAANNTFSKKRLTTFYDTFFCEQKNDLHSVCLTPSCSLHDGSVRPPAPPFIQGLLGIVLVNQSTLDDADVYIVVTGKNQTTQEQVFVSIDPSTGIGTLVVAADGDNALNYGLSLSQLPIGSTGRVIYLPNIIGGEVWISMNNKLNMPTNGNDIVQPNFSSTDDPNYYTNFDIFELAYTTNSAPNIVADATAVSFHSLSLVGYISTPSSSNDTTGLSQNRSTVLNAMSAAFAAAPESDQWNKLFLRNGGEVLRVLSPGKGTLAPTANQFDPNYLDNAAAYNFSYIEDIWTGGSAFYKTHDLKLTIPNGSLETYTGEIQLDDTITFTSAPSGYVVTFAAPVTTTPSTTFNILSGITLVASDNSPGQADGVQLSKLFEEAIIAGLVPTANTLSNEYLTENQANYYQFNSNLGTTAATGPWYDLYSKSLHDLGYIYTFAFDEPLWPQVQIFSNSLIENETYMGITIRSIQ